MKQEEARKVMTRSPGGTRRTVQIRSTITGSESDSEEEGAIDKIVRMAGGGSSQGKLALAKAGVSRTDVLEE